MQDITGASDLGHRPAVHGQKPWELHPGKGIIAQRNRQTAAAAAQAFLALGPPVAWALYLDAVDHLMGGSAWRVQGNDAYLGPLLYQGVRQSPDKGPFPIPRPARERW